MYVLSSKSEITTQSSNSARLTVAFAQIFFAKCTQTFLRALVMAYTARITGLCCLYVATSLRERKLNSNPSGRSLASTRLCYTRHVTPQYIWCNYDIMGYVTSAPTWQTTFYNKRRVWLFADLNWRVIKYPSVVNPSTESYILSQYNNSCPRVSYSALYSLEYFCPDAVSYDEMTPDSLIYQRFISSRINLYGILIFKIIFTICRIICLQEYTPLLNLINMGSRYCSYTPYLKST